MGILHHGQEVCLSRTSPWTAAGDRGAAHTASTALALTKRPKRMYLSTPEVLVIYWDEGAFRKLVLYGDRPGGLVEEAALVQRKRELANDPEDWLKQVAAAFRGGDLAEPPAWVVARARALFRAHGPRPQASQIRRLLARLVFDSRAHPAPVGLRAGEMGERRVLYRADDLDLDLSVRPSAQPGSVLFRGQALRASSSPAVLAGGEVLLLREEQVFAHTRLDEAGQFLLDPVPPGPCRLVLALPEEEVVVEGLDLVC